MDQRLRLLIGLAAIFSPGLHIASDLLEWVDGAFSTPQLYASYVAFLVVPFLMVGLYAVQRPKIGGVGLLGALLYGASFVYFAYTALYAAVAQVPNYEMLWQQLGGWYSFHGGVMIVGGLLFGVASLRALVMPRWTASLFVGGVGLNLLFGLIPVPDMLQTLGSLLRNAGIIGMGVTLLRNPLDPHPAAG